MPSFYLIFLSFYYFVVFLNATRIMKFVYITLLKWGLATYSVFFNFSVFVPLILNGWWARGHLLRLTYILTERLVNLLFSTAKIWIFAKPGVNFGTNTYSCTWKGKSSSYWNEIFWIKYYKIWTTSFFTNTPNVAYATRNGQQLYSPRWCHYSLCCSGRSSAFHGPCSVSSSSDHNLLNAVQAH